MPLKFWIHLKFTQ